MLRFAAIPAAFLMLAGSASAGTSAGDHSIAGQPVRMLLRGVEPTTTGSVEPTSAPSSRPPCPPERRIGTGAGFCMIN